MSSNLVVTAGETMGLFSSSTTGILSQGSEFRFSIGGAESNVAIGLSRLGTPSHWIGRVGDDEVGRAVVAALRSESVGISAIVNPRLPTATMFRTRRIPGHTAVTYQRRGSAGSSLEPNDFDAALIESASAVHITGITPALSESASAAIDRLVDLAAAARIPVSMDLNFRAALWGRDAAGRRLASLAPRCQLIFAGDDEAALITGASDVDGHLRVFASWGVQQAVLKRGADGAAALIDGRRYDADAIPIQPVDTVGAGDAFVAGYLHAWLEGVEAPGRLQLANRVGAFQCLAEGDWEGMPRVAELGMLDQVEPVTR